MQIISSTTFLKKTIMAGCICADIYFPVALRHAKKKQDAIKYTKAGIKEILLNNHAKLIKNITLINLSLPKSVKYTIKQLC
jgi:hypothetical protein